MTEQLLQDIAAYFRYLREVHGDYAAFHNFIIPLDRGMVSLAPYNINSCPYCLFVKSKPEVWNHCIARQERLREICSGGPFRGTCYAGIGEYVFPIQEADGTVLGFISVGGYALDPELACRKMRHFAGKYRLDYSRLQKVYRETALPEADRFDLMEARIAPLCHMFVLLYRELQGIYGSSRESLRQTSILGHAIVYMNKNYTQNIHAADIAEYCHCSVSTLSHLFKDKTAMSIPDYIRDLRLNRAENLLTGTDLTVVQIADLLGFCNSNYFCRSFSSRYGLSPSVFRKQAKNRQQELKP